MAKKINKVVYAGETLLDLTADTATAATVLSGATFHDKAGNSVTGTCTYDSNTQDATVAVSEMLATKTAYARGAKLTGTMPNNGAVSGTISTVAGTYTVPQGYHDGSGTVSISSTEQAKLIASNIREGVTVLGVTGTMSVDTENPQASKTVTPSTTQQTVLPDSGYTCLQQVVVNAISYVLSDNAAGGQTATIAGA